MYIWLNLKLPQEGAGNSSWKYVNESRRTCCVADIVRKASNKTTKTLAHFLAETSLAKQDLLESSASPS